MISSKRINHQTNHLTINDKYNMKKSTFESQDKFQNLTYQEEYKLVWRYPIQQFNNDKPTYFLRKEFDCKNYLPTLKSHHETTECIKYKPYQHSKLLFGNYAYK